MNTLARIFKSASVSPTSNLPSNSGSTSINSSESGGDFFTDIIDKIVDFFKFDAATLAIRIVLALLVFVAGYYLIKLVIRIIKKMLLRPGKNGKKIDFGIVSFLCSVIKFVLNFLLVFLVLAILNVPLGGLVSIVSASVLAIGLALQDTIANFANGIFLLSAHNFATGDYISVEGVEGTVIEFNMMSIILLTPDKKRIVVPNSVVAKATVTNYSTEPVRRISINIEVSYDTDLVKARSIILATVDQNEKVLRDPMPQVQVSEFKHSAINMVVKLYCKNEDYWDVFYDLNEKIFIAIRDAGIEIPFTQLDINLKNNIPALSEEDMLNLGIHEKKTRKGKDQK